MTDPGRKDNGRGDYPRLVCLRSENLMFNIEKEEGYYGPGCTEVRGDIGRFR